jgi:putative endonuclease
MARNPTVYILTNKPNGVLYVGVTADLPARVAQHRRGEGSAFCKRYNLTRLVHAEACPDIATAIAREKAIKAWRRAWKVEQMERANPGWDELMG